MAGGGRGLPAHRLGLRRAKGRCTSKRSIFASSNSVAIVSSPTLACSRSTSASRASAGRLFSDAPPPARNRSRQPLSSAADTPSSRETSSRSSPRSRRSTASRLRPADMRRRGSGVGPSPPAWWARSAGPTPTPTVSSILTSLQSPTCKAVSQRTVGRGTERTIRLRAIALQVQETVVQARHAAAVAGDMAALISLPAVLGNLAYRQSAAGDNVAALTSVQAVVRAYRTLESVDAEQVSIPRQSRGHYDVSRSKRLFGDADAAPASGPPEGGGHRQRFSCSSRASSFSCCLMYARIASSFRPTVDTK